jgi:site-specific DNA-cytosine methylase
MSGPNTSPAVMQQRHEPHNSLDDFPTPPWATRALCERLGDLSGLTARECERLQGFHDDYTLLSDSVKPQADGPRYKQLGNSWAVNCIDWIAERIAIVDGWNGVAA